MIGLPNSGNACRLVSIGSIVSRYGVSLATIRRATKAGRLQCHTLPSGHRRFLASEVESWLGRTPEKEEEKLGGRIVCIIRVSNKTQADSLVNQKELLTKWSVEHYGKSPDVYIERVASGMDFAHPVLLTFVNDLLNGEYKGCTIICKDKTRIMRTAHRLIEHLIARSGAKLIYTHPVLDESAQQEMVSELLSVMTHYTARESARRSTIVTQRTFSEEVWMEVIKMKENGLGWRPIVDALIEKGFTTEQGSKISYSHLRRRWAENRELIYRVWFEKMGRMPNIVEPKEIGVHGCGEKVKVERDYTKVCS